MASDDDEDFVHVPSVGRHFPLLELAVRAPNEKQTLKLL